MSTNVLRIPAVQTRTGLKRSTIYKHVKLGNFPPPIKLCSRAVGWLEEDIDKWIDTRIIINPKKGI